MVNVFMVCIHLVFLCVLFHDFLDRGDGESDEEEEEPTSEPDPKKQTDEVIIVILEFLLSLSLYLRKH